MKSKVFNNFLSLPLLIQGVRPRTLSLAFVPVSVGTAMAWQQNQTISWLIFVVTLLSAICIQAGTNLFNDAADGEKGNDGTDRIGPQRLTGSGLALSSAVRRTAWLLFLVAFVSGIYLVLVGGWIILSVGLFALIMGWAYSCGPAPLSYGAYSEFVVVLFFGIIAVAGSYYLQTNNISPDALVIGTVLGLQAAAVLLINNLRDHEADQIAGRRTLVHVIGAKNAFALYSFMILVGFPLVFLLIGSLKMLQLVWLLLPLAVWLLWRCWKSQLQTQMNKQLALTALFQLLFGSFMVLSIILSVNNAS